MRPRTNENVIELGRARRGVAAITAMAWLLLAASPGIAATNQATGDIAGVDADLTDSNTMTITSSTLALVNRAFNTDGTPIADGASVPKGSTIYFLVYVNNTTAIPVSDLSVRDVLAAGFQYQAGTLKVDNSIDSCTLASCTGVEEAAVFAAVAAAAAGTDAVDGDVVSITGTTIDVGNQAAANGQLDIAASKVWAMLFAVKVQ